MTMPDANTAAERAHDAEQSRRDERMDIGFAVFNCHINDARDRADREFIAQFGQEVFDGEIKPFHDSGIMSIFNKPPTLYPLVWVSLVTAFVNEGRA